MGGVAGSGGVESVDGIAAPASIVPTWRFEAASADLGIALDDPIFAHSYLVVALWSFPSILS